MKEVLLSAYLFQRGSGTLILYLALLVNDTSINGTQDYLKAQQRSLPQFLLETVVSR
jgi:hypothetical protein